MLALLVVTGCGRGNGDEIEEVAKKQVKIQTIQKQNQVTTDLTVSGTIIPKEYTLIRSLTPGTVEYVVPVGSPVSVGESLFRIRDENIENNYFNSLQNFRQTEILANQRVNQAELALSSTQARFDLAQRNLETAVLQSEQNLINAQDSAVIEYNSTYNTLNQFFIFVSAGELTNDEFVYRNVGTSQLELRGNTELAYLSAVKSFLKLSNLVNFTNIDQSLNDITQVQHKAPLTTVCSRSRRARLAFGYSI
jgi:multidrug efflux pump subunit AcrA (membrane-fusion protein)